jgi:hypothetical protein
MGCHGRRRLVIGRSHWRCGTGNRHRCGSGARCVHAILRYDGGTLIRHQDRIRVSRKNIVQNGRSTRISSVAPRTGGIRGNTGGIRGNTGSIRGNTGSGRATNGRLRSCTDIRCHRLTLWRRSIGLSDDGGGYAHRRRCSHRRISDNPCVRSNRLNANRMRRRRDRDGCGNGSRITPDRSKGW